MVTCFWFWRYGFHVRCFFWMLFSWIAGMVLVIFFLAFTLAFPPSVVTLTLMVLVPKFIPNAEGVTPITGFITIIFRILPFHTSVHIHPGVTHIAAEFWPWVLPLFLLGGGKLHLSSYSILDRSTVHQPRCQAPLCFGISWLSYWYTSTVPGEYLRK